MSGQAQKQTSTDTPSPKVISLNFKIPSDKHRRFKLIAAAMGKSMTELIEESIDRIITDATKGGPQ